MTNTRTPLAELPNMDDLAIGPAGETFGQLKARVIDQRQQFMAALMQPGGPGDALMDSYKAAQLALQAAYESVGLEYIAP